MDLSTKIAGLAKRLPATALGSEFEYLVRSIGEAKSKAEEDDLVMRMIEITKYRIKEGFSSKGQNQRALKDFLVYLVYIDMLGHDTSWACASVIQLCGNKSLQVKKVAYLTASLLIDPKSDMTILLTATIQADLKSDNFLTVCTALQAIPTIANQELVNVFMPEVVHLVKHDKDAVKKRALLTIHALLEVDPTIAPEVEKLFIDKLGYKEPSVMTAVLPALHSLIKRNPEPYRGLVHYFTNILKQAAEGKLGKVWVVHKAPAPFLQIILLRMLALLGKGNGQSSGDMQVILMDVWKRADSLMNQAGNAILFECMRTATTIAPSDALYSMTLDTAARFLASSDNNMKCAGIQVLGRLIEDGDPGKVQQHQLAIVDCLRSSDVTLKSRTLDILFKMTGPNNFEIVFTEVLNYVMDSSIDDESRQAACLHLLDIAEKYSPSLHWFVDHITELLKTAEGIAPPSAEDLLIRVLREGSGNMETDMMLRHRTANMYFKMLHSPKLPLSLLRVMAWTLGEYGLDAGIPFESICSSLCDVVETQGNSPELLVVVIISLAKICASSGRSLPQEAMDSLSMLRRSRFLEVQQAAFETYNMLREGDALKNAIFPKNGGIMDFSYLDTIAEEAAKAGSAPYLSKEERRSLGMHSGLDEFAAVHTDLKFEAYVQSDSATSEQPGPPAPVDDLFANFQIQDTSDPASHPSISSDQQVASTVTAPLASSGTTLHVDRRGPRRWGPGATAAAQTAPSPVSRLHDLHSSSTQGTMEPTPQSTSRSRPREERASQSVDPAQQQLAASLFASAFSSGSMHSRSEERVPEPSFDLLGEPMGTAQHSQTAHTTIETDMMDLLGDVEASSENQKPLQVKSDEVSSASQPNWDDLMSSFGQSQTTTTQYQQPSTQPQQPDTQPQQPGAQLQQPGAQPSDPFSNLLD